MHRNDKTDPYRTANVKDWDGYIAAAQKADVARLREPMKGGTWTVQIHPAYFTADGAHVGIHGNLDSSSDRIIGQSDPPSQSPRRSSRIAHDSKQRFDDNYWQRFDETEQPDHPWPPSPNSSFGAFGRKPGAGNYFPHQKKHTLTFDPRRKDQNVLNGRTFPQEFVLLTMALRNQMKEGRLDSFGHFLQKLLKRFGHVFNKAEFESFLKRARDADVIEVVEGERLSHLGKFRLHPSLVSSSVDARMGVDLYAGSHRQDRIEDQSRR